MKRSHSCNILYNNYFHKNHESYIKNLYTENNIYDHIAHIDKKFFHYIFDIYHIAVKKTLYKIPNVYPFVILLYIYSTVTTFAKLRGISGFNPFDSDSS